MGDKMGNFCNFMLGVSIAAVLAALGSLVRVLATRDPKFRRVPEAQDAPKSVLAQCKEGYSPAPYDPVRFVDMETVEKAEKPPYPYDGYVKQVVGYKVDKGQPLVDVALRESLRQPGEFRRRMCGMAHWDGGGE